MCIRDRPCRGCLPPKGSLKNHPCVTLHIREGRFEALDRFWTFTRCSKGRSQGVHLRKMFMSSSKVYTCETLAHVLFKWYRKRIKKSSSEVDSRTPITGYSWDSECTFRFAVTFGNERPLFFLVDSSEIFHVNVQIHAYRSGMVAGVKMCLPALGYNLSMVDNY